MKKDKTIDPLGVCPTCPRSLVCAALPAPEFLVLSLCPRCKTRVTLTAWFDDGRAHLCRTFDNEENAIAEFPLSVCNIHDFHEDEDTEDDHSWLCTRCGGMGVSHEWDEEPFSSVFDEW